MNAPIRTFYVKKYPGATTLYSVRYKDASGRDEHEEYADSQAHAVILAAKFNKEELAANNPVVGTRGTRLCYTDREPVVVTEVSKDGKTVTVMELETEMIKGPVLEPGGFSAFVVEEAKWKILNSVVEGSHSRYSLRKNGRWVHVGNEAKRGEAVTFHYCSKFYDHAF
jgi:hypothetical protein